MRWAVAAALTVALTVSAADAMQPFNAVKSLILGGSNSGNHTVTVPTPTAPPSTGGGGGGGGGTDCPAIQADFSDATGCNAALLAALLLF